MPARKLILKHHYALGDTILLTALTRDLQLSFPGQFELVVDTHFREVFENHPHARCLRRDEALQGPNISAIDINYKPGILAAQRGQKIHMLAWYHRCFAAATGLDLTPLLPHGDLRLSEVERKPIVEGRYWLLMSGWKNDNTTKGWWPHRYQQVVNALARLGIRSVQGGASFRDCINPQLQGVVNLVGQTNNARQLFNLIYHADGVICSITAAMHIAACFQKPCVVLAGGREDWYWEAYANLGNFGPRCQPVAVEHRFLHTVGLLDCCKHKGCWKHRTVALNDNRKWDQPEHRCKLAVQQSYGAAPKCMDLITADHVLEAVMSYYDNGVIPPIGEPRRTYSLGDNPLAPPPPTPENSLPDPVPPVVDNPGTSPIQKPAFGLPTPVSLMDHPFIGGKFTVCCLCFGPYPDLARSCLGSILQTLPRERLDLRVALAAACPETKQYVRTLPVTKIYEDDSNPGKYILMRRMFHDPDCPITTPYLVWVDDDSRIIQPSVWNDLCETIVANQPHGSRMYGTVFTHDLQMYQKNGHDPYQWFRSASWWRNRDLQVRGRDMTAPNGSVIRFAVGWFWCLATEVIRELDIPDARLVHNGGDVVIGAAVGQGGYKIKNFNVNKTYVFTPTREQGGRRGRSDRFAWAPQ